MIYNDRTKTSPLCRMWKKVGRLLIHLLRATFIPFSCLQYQLIF